MSLELPSRLGLDTPEGEKLYLPRSEDLRAGCLNPDEDAVYNTADAVTMINSGMKPGGDRTIVRIGDDYGVIDIVGAHVQPNEVRIAPTAQAAVNAETFKIERESWAVLTFPGGERQRMFAFALDNKRESTRRHLGSSVILNSLGWNAIDLDIEEDNNGATVSKLRRPIHRFNWHKKSSIV